jgi:Domain of unknown function (DUF4833)
VDVRFDWLAAAAVVLAAGGLGGDARAGEGSVDRWGVPSVFFVAKSENRNQVHYGIHLDDQCAPVGDAPVYAYWRMFERGPSATEPLLPRENRAYGIAEQRVLERGPRRGRTRVTLNALTSRAMVVESYSDGTRCVARALMPIDGAPSVLGDVFVQLRWPFGVAYMLVSGHALDGGAVVNERVEP